MSHQISLKLSQIPKDIGGARLDDLYYFFDNFAGEEAIAIPPKMDFPVKSETMLVITLLEGTMKLRINLQEVNVLGGQSLGLMPGCIFQLLERSQEIRYLGMMVDPDVVNQIQKNLNLRIDLAHRYYFFDVHSLDASAIEISQTMYHLIKEELNQPNYEYKKEVILRYCEIWILKNVSLSDSEHKPEICKPAGRKEQIFRDFLTLLGHYYSQERSISFYADRMCLTPKYLSTIIKEVSGKHGMQWIDEYVALEAKTLLREGSMNVKQISDKLKFPSQSMFGRFFKKMTGYSPKQYMLL